MKTLITFLILLSTGHVFAQAISRNEFNEIKERLPFEKNKAKRAELFYRAANYYLEKEELSEKQLDSSTFFNNQLIKHNNQPTTEKSIAQSMLLSARIAEKKGNSSLSTSLKRKALDYAKKNGLIKEEAEVYRVIALDLSDDNPNKKTQILQKAISIFKKAGALNAAAEAMNDLVKVYSDNNEPDSCFKYLQQAVDIKKGIKSHNLYKEYVLLAENYGSRGDIEAALRFGLAAEKNAENMKADVEWLFNIYNIIGVAYSELKFDHKSIEYYKKAIALGPKIKDANGLYNVTVNTALSLYHIKKDTEALEILLDFKRKYPLPENCESVRYNSLLLLICTQLKQYDNAKSAYQQLLQCDNEKIQYRIVKETMYYAMIKYLMVTKQTGKTYTYISKLSKLAQHGNDPLSFSELEKVHYQADSAAGNYHGAFLHLRRFKVIKDSIWNIKKSKQIADLQLKYETEKKDKNIELLTQQGKLQKVKIQNATTLSYVFIGGLLVLVIIVALLHNRSRLKQRTNKALELKQQRINEQNDQLKKLLTEKEWLVKEIHHRVKNNLQVVISLLNTQSGYLKNKDALMAIQNSQNRMHAMSLIHQKLYQSDNLDAIDISWYINELVHHLRESFNMDQKIGFKLDTESVKLEVTQAVPLGLILNEAISNAMKYAFADRDHGQIGISLKSIGTDSYRLTIADDGIGLPENFESHERESLGMDLMIGLTDQLDGTFEIGNTAGLSIAVTFTKKKQLVEVERNILD